MLQMQIHQDPKLEKRAVIILLGSAGSGKSSILQKMFIESVKGWKSGDPIPIFMNLAIHYDLQDYWKYLQDSLDLKNLHFVDLIEHLNLASDDCQLSALNLKYYKNLY
jgi:predicted GTPase